MGKKTKIDWCDATWNPVTGCLRGCEYCYARKIAERFGGAYSFECEEKRDAQGKIIYQEDGLMPEFEKCGVYKSVPNGSIHVLEKRWTEQDAITCAPFEELEGRAPRTYPYPYSFDPTFHKYLLGVPQYWKKPRTIFVCSMADLFGDWVPDEWITEVFRACDKAHWHRYIFLTKNPKRYQDLAEKEMLPDGDNYWFGTTTTTKGTEFFFNRNRNVFASIEPILEPFGEINQIGDLLDWIIVGAETGNRKDKVIPQREWIMEIANACKRDGVPLFMKESLRTIMGDDFRQEFPWEVRK